MTTLASSTGFAWTVRSRFRGHSEARVWDGLRCERRRQTLGLHRGVEACTRTPGQAQDQVFDVGVLERVGELTPVLLTGKGGVLVVGEEEGVLAAQTFDLLQYR